MNTPNQPRPRHVPIPSPEQVTSQQVDTILQLVATLQPFVVAPSSDFEASKREIDKETATSASATLIRACNRLDEILDDKSRWGIEGHSKLMESIVRNHDEQHKFLVAQTAASKSLSRPMFLMKPNIVCVEDGLFVAYIGDVGSPGCGLAGKGSTPEAAYADFDAAFTRNAEEQLRLVSSSPPPPATKTKQTRKKK